MRPFLALLLTLLFALPALAADEPELVLQNGHMDAILVVAVSADGKTAVSAGEDETARVWDLQTGRVRATLDGHRREDGYASHIRGLAIDPAARIAITGGGDGRALVWDLATARVRTELPTGADTKVFSVALSPDGKRVATGSDDKILRLWDLATRQHVELKTEGTPNAIAFSSDGKLLAVGADYVEGTLLLDAATLKPVKTLPAEDDVLSVAFSPDGRYLAVGGDSSHLQIFDTGTWKQRGTAKLESPFGLRALAFTNDSLAVAAEDGAVRLYDLDARPKAEVEGNQGGAFALAALPDGGLLSGGADRMLRVWAADGKPGLVLQGHSRPVVSTRFSKDGHTLLSGGFEGTARLWDTEAGRLRVAVGTQEVASNAADLSPGGTTVALAGFDGILRLYGTDGSLKYELQGQRPKGSMGSYGLDAVAFDPAGGLVATAGPERVDVWDVAQGRKRVRLEQPSPAALAWSPDGRRIVTGGWDGQVRVWDLATKAIVETRKVPSDRSYTRAVSVAFSPDGTKIAAGTYDARVLVWELGFEEEPVVLDASAGPARPVWDLAWSPDGRTLLAASDRSPVLLDLATRKPRILGYHRDAVSAVTFSPDGRKVVSGGRDGTLRIWDLQGKLLATAVELDGGADWVVTTPEGLFDGSSGGQRFIEWRIGDRLYGLEQFFVDHYSPGLMGQLLAGSKTERPQPVAQVVRDTPPPRVEIVSPAPGAELAETTATVTVKATDQGGGVSGVRLFHNGHRLPDSESLTWTVTLVEGANRFRASAFNKAGTVESRPDEIAIASTAVAARKPELYVLSVGVDRYLDGSMNLEFAADDAKAVAGLFEPGLFAKIHRSTLTDSEATKAAILGRLESISRSATPQDAFVLFMAGHGTLLGDVFYYLPHDANLASEDTIRDTGISAIELSQDIRNIPAVKQVVVLDACHSGASARLMTRSVELPKAQQALARNSGSFLIAASSPEQKAGEVEALGHGVLTYAILQAVKPGSGVTTVNGLLRFVSDEVPRVAERYLKLQQQVTQYSNGQDFPLLVR